MVKAVTMKMSNKILSRGHIFLKVSSINKVLKNKTVNNHITDFTLNHLSILFVFYTCKKKCFKLFYFDNDF